MAFISLEANHRRRGGARDFSRARSVRHRYGLVDQAKGEASMPKFVQIMEIKTSRVDEVESLSTRMQEERGDALLANKATLTADRDRPGYYLIIVEFDSYERAMENSNDPETGKYAAQLGELLDAPPKFYNLDVRTEM
jgi:hypothetical protein